MEEYLKDQGLISGEGEASSHQIGGISKVLEAARSKAAMDTAEEDKREAQNKNKGGHGDQISQPANPSESSEKGNNSGLGSLSKLIDKAKGSGLLGGDGK